MAVRKILEDDFGYKETSDRLAGYQNRNRPGQIPVPSGEAAIKSTENPEDKISASDDIRSTANFSNKAAATSEKDVSLPISYKAGEVLFGRYRFIEKLGSGSSSIVCRVKDQEIDDEVALKVLDRSQAFGTGLEQFKKEIKIARKLNHPNIVSIYDYGKRDGHHFITLELVVGSDLKTIMEKEGRFSAEKGLPLVLQICDGLQAIHEQGIIHRDLKPQNIKLRNDGVIKILDFGLASNHDLSSQSQASQENTLVGSVAYMSPEQIQGRNLDQRSDIYSLGVILYELFTEQSPFDGKELKGLIYQQLNDQPTPPSTINPGLSKELEACILKCMSKEPQQRYGSCKELIEVLCKIGGLRKTAGPGAIEKPKVINDRYEIKSEIGRGGMGVVYRAHDLSLQRDVALKFLPHELSSSPDDLQAFLNEARSAARLNHNNIVTIHNIEKFDKEHFIVMEFIDGIDIHNLLETMEKLPFKSIELICRQVCDALDYAHKRKVFHRDIKSANLLWTNDKIVKITDFGLAKIAEGALAASTRVQGSPAYMSPEQILGKNVDHRTDLYSLGVALYEMTCGSVPFAKGDIAYHQLHTQAVPIEEYRPDTPEHLRTIINRCMKKIPDERFQNASEIISLLPK
jgi:serine/threonine protein kinase